MSESSSKMSGVKIPGDKTVASNYINKSNIINEKSSDNDFDNSNINENDYDPNDPSNIHEREYRRFTLEFIKVLGLYKKDKKNEEINISEIANEYKIPKDLVIDKIEEEIDENKENKENKDNKEQFEISEEEIKEDKIDFDNDVQPTPILNEEMKIIIYLSKPKIVGFDGKLGLFYIVPPPVGREADYHLIVKNPQNMKIIFKTKIIEILTFLKKNDNCLTFQNFGNKILMKTNHELTFKNKEDCSMVHQGITYLINNKVDDYFY